jgi:hypothetical protein
VPPGFYDGFAPPADTYRWVKPPAAVTTNGQKPLTGVVSLPVSSDHTRVAAGGVATGESPSQARLEIPAAAFNAPAANSVEVDLAPTAATGRPADAIVVGNLYCVTATASLATGHQLSLTLTYSTQLPGADAIYRFDDTTLSWARLPTRHDSRAATVSASISSLGCFAPAASTATATPAPGGRSGGVPFLPVIVGGLLVLVLLAGLPLYIRLRRDRRRKG